VFAAVSTWCLLLLAVSAKILALKLRDLDYAAPPPGLLLKAAGEPETLLHFAHWLLASIWAGAALTLLYMLLRRNRDDYGRDYYVYSSRITARWTWIFGMAQLIPWGVLAYRIIPALDSEVRRGSLVPAAAFVLFSLIACVLWIGVSRSETPMRKKPSMIAGAVLLWLALSAHAAYLVMAYELFPLIVRAVQA
jgi:putative copper export protein